MQILYQTENRKREILPFVLKRLILLELQEVFLLGSFASAQVSFFFVLFQYLLYLPMQCRIDCFQFLRNILMYSAFADSEMRRGRTYRCAMRNEKFGKSNAAFFM